MKLDASSRILTLTVCLVGLVTSRRVHAADTAKDEAAVKALAMAFDKAMNAKDADALSTVFHEDATFTNVVGMTAHGRKAIADFHRPLFEGDGTKGFPSFKNATFKAVETRVRFIRPDVASVDVVWTQTGSVLAGKDRGPRRGLMIWIATNERGKWGVAVMHNMDLLPVERPKTP